jgi:exosome complex component RRP42
MEELYALELIQQDKRIDERKLDEFRPITINPGLIKNAEGSAEVMIGETHVIAGVKLKTGEPFPDTQEQGILIVNAEFTPLASPEFESGPPGEDAIELARVVDRGLRESQCIDLDKLCITPKEKVWCVFVDIYIINDGGNLIDCAALAAISALLSAKLPKIENDEIVRGEYTDELPIKHKSVNITVAKVGNKFLLDPEFREESIVDVKLSISVREDGKICAMQKIGKQLKVDDVEKMIDMAMKKSKEISKLLK